MAATGSALFERPDQQTAPGAGPATLDTRLPAIEPEVRRPSVPEVPARTPTRPAWVKALLLAGVGLVVAVGAVLGVRYWRFAATHVSTDDAYLTADVTQIAPEVSGTVKRVLVKDNQAVKEGDLLVVLDGATYRAAVAQAQANLDAAIAQSRGAGAGVSLTAETGSAQVLQAQAAVAQAESGIAGASADVARNEAGVHTAVASARSAEASVGTARAAVDAAVANKARAGDAIRAAQAQVATAQAGVRAAQAQVEAAQAVADKAARDARRYAALVAEGAVSAQTADQADSAAREAQAQVEAARQQVAQAQATVAQKQADLNAARQQWQAADAAIAQAKAQQVAAEEQAAAVRAGIRQAEAQRHAAQQSVRQAEARRQQALGQLEQARTAPRQVAVSRSAQAQANAKIEQARAALDAARIQLEDTRIYAPVSGRVSKKSVEVGALVQPGTPLMALVPQSDPWVVANFKETQLGGVRAGQPVTVHVDALPGRPFRGRVESLAAGTGSTFALLPADNATGNFTKVVQRVPVKIVLDPSQPGAELLRAGMSVTAVVATR
jgi:membrane fusion protein, multidrug efflux system